MGKTNTRNKRSNAKHRSGNILKDRLNENKNPVYVKFELEDALYSKKRIISSEIGILKLSKIIKRYSLYRQAELENKIKMLKKIEEVKEEIEKIMNNFPRIKEKKETEEVMVKRIQGISEDEAENSLERQLEEIQRRLKEFN